MLWVTTRWDLCMCLPNLKSLYRGLICVYHIHLLDGLNEMIAILRLCLWAASESRKGSGINIPNTREGVRSLRLPEFSSVSPGSHVLLISFPVIPEAREMLLSPPYSFWKVLNSGWFISISETDLWRSYLWFGV